MAELFLKSGCLHFVPGFVNEHQRDPTVMRRGRSGWKLIISLTRENETSESVSMEMSQLTWYQCGKRLICNSRYVPKSGLIWREKLVSTEKYWCVIKDCRVINISAPSTHCSHYKPLLLQDTATCVYVFMFLYTYCCHCSDLTTQ